MEVGGDDSQVRNQSSSVGSCKFHWQTTDLG